jgi:hypothetical protein
VGLFVVKAYLDPVDVVQPSVFYLLLLVVPDEISILADKFKKVSNFKLKLRKN